MMRVWRWLFTPATVCVGLALALALPAVILMQPRWWAFLLILLIALLTGGWWRWYRPILGAED